MLGKDTQLRGPPRGMLAQPSLQAIQWLIQQGYSRIPYFFDSPWPAAASPNQPASCSSSPPRPETAHGPCSLHCSTSQAGREGGQDCLTQRPGTVDCLLTRVRGRRNHCTSQERSQKAGNGQRQLLASLGFLFKVFVYQTCTQETTY